MLQTRSGRRVQDSLSRGVPLADRRRRDVLIQQTTSAYIACPTPTPTQHLVTVVLLPPRCLFPIALFCFEISGQLFPARWRIKQNGGGGGCSPGGRCFRPRRHEHRTLNVVMNIKIYRWPAACVRLSHRSFRLAHRSHRLAHRSHRQTQRVKSVMVWLRLNCRGPVTSLLMTCLMLDCC